MTARRIVVIDSDPWLFRLLACRAGQRGYKVIHQPDPTAAVATVVHHQPALVITDLHSGWSDMGLDVVDELRSVPATSDVPILIVSSDPEVEGRVASLRRRHVVALWTHTGVTRLLSGIERLAPPDGGPPLV